MNSKKGFTLIELLAVIVILAIIMVIAVPQILKVIDNSRDSAWENSAKLLERAIVLNTTLNSGNQSYTISSLCSDTSKISQIADLGDIDTISCTPDENNNKYSFNVSGKGQFEDKTALVLCTKESKCEVMIGNELYLYNRGNENISVVGSWDIGNGQGNGQSEKLSDSVHLSASSIFYCESHMETANEIDFTGYSKVNIEYKLNSISNYDYGCLNYNIGTSSGRSPNVSQGTYTESFDINVSSGKIYFWKCACDINIYKIWLER